MFIKKAENEASCVCMNVFYKNGSSVKFVGKLWLGKLAKRMI